MVSEYVDDEYIHVNKYLVSGYGSFEKWWYRAEIRVPNGNYGVGFGAQRLVAVKHAVEDLAKGGRSPAQYADVLSKDAAGRLCCVDKSGAKYTLIGERWVRSSK